MSSFTAIYFAADSLLSPAILAILPEFALFHGKNKYCLHVVDLTVKLRFCKNIIL